MSKEIKISEIAPSFKKESGLWVLSLDDIPLPEDFDVVDKSIVCIPANVLGGNHKHPRKELFVGVGEGLEFIWLDDEGKKHNHKMNPDGKLLTFFVPSYIPHAIINNSSVPGLLIELATSKQTIQDVERINIASS